MISPGGLDNRWELNGPELPPSALRDRCAMAGNETINMEPGSPLEEPYVKSFDSRTRNELVHAPHAHLSRWLDGA